MDAEKLDFMFTQLEDELTVFKLTALQAELALMALLGATSDCWR